MLPQIFKIVALTLNYFMDWLHHGEPFTAVPPDTIGFVYRITRLTDGKKYIGRKSFFKAVTKPPLKGKTRKRRSTVESDWRRYYGSNDELKSSVAILGQTAFQREILTLCPTLGEIKYQEARQIMVEDAIRSPDYFNKWLSITVNANQLRPPP